MHISVRVCRSLSVRVIIIIVCCISQCYSVVFCINCEITSISTAKNTDSIYCCTMGIFCDSGLFNCSVRYFICVTAITIATTIPVTIVTRCAVSKYNNYFITLGFFFVIFIACFSIQYTICKFHTKVYVCTAACSKFAADIIVVIPVTIAIGVIAYCSTYSIMVCLDIHILHSLGIMLLCGIGVISIV